MVATEHNMCGDGQTLTRHIISQGYRARLERTQGCLLIHRLIRCWVSCVVWTDATVTSVLAGVTGIMFTD